MLPDEGSSGGGSKKTVSTAGGAKASKPDSTEPVGKADAIGDPENPTAGNEEPKSIEEKALDVQRLFLRNVFMILCAQWSMMVVAILLVTYWLPFRNFVVHWFKPFELTLLFPMLLASICTLLIFKTDATKNTYVFGAFTGAFIACVSVASTYAYDDHWLLFGFLIVTIYVHVFTLLQLDNVWSQLIKPYIGAYTLNLAHALSLIATFMLSFFICAYYGWWRHVVGAGVFGGLILLYGICDTYLLVKNLAPEDVIIALICLYTDPINMVVSMFAYCVKAIGDCAEGNKKSTASNAFD